MEHRQPNWGGVKLHSDNIHDRRIEWRRYVAEHTKTVKRGSHFYDEDGNNIENKQSIQVLHNIERLQALEGVNGARLVPLERLQSLEGLESLTRLESLTSLDYHDYVYQEGDVVYCDIPYELSKNRSKDYDGGFDHDEFFKWAKAQKYPVYYSSYTRGKVLWQKEVRSVMNSGSGGVDRNECLFVL